jgi:hypothetical protein
MINFDAVSCYLSEKKILPLRKAVSYLVTAKPNNKNEQPE